MSIEQLLMDNVKAIHELQQQIADLREHIRLSFVPSIVVHTNDSMVIEKEELAEIVKKGLQLTFADVRNRVDELAAEHHDAIKALNTKYGLKRLKEMLVDQNDPAAGVKSQDDLEAYYAELDQLGGSMT